MYYPDVFSYPVFRMAFGDEGEILRHHPVHIPLQQEQDDYFVLIPDDLYSAVEDLYVTLDRKGDIPHSQWHSEFLYRFLNSLTDISETPFGRVDQRTFQERDFKLFCEYITDAIKALDPVPANLSAGIRKIESFIEYCTRYKESAFVNPISPFHDSLGQLKQGVQFIHEERKRQIENEGFKDDSRYVNGELALAAAAYALPGYAAAVRVMVDGKDPKEMEELLWPFSPKWYKRSDKDLAGRIRSLSKAGALIAAEIDRLIQAEAAALDLENGTAKEDAQ